MKVMHTGAAGGEPDPHAFVVGVVPVCRPGRTLRAAR